MSNQKTLWIGSSVLVITAAVLVLVQMKIVPGRDFLGYVGMGGATSSSMPGTSPSSSPTTYSSPAPQGACCNKDQSDPSKSCSPTTEKACTDNGHKWIGPSSSCTPTNPCSSSSSSASCKDTDDGTGVVCGGPCSNLQQECQPSDLGTTCFCRPKGVSCGICAGGNCNVQWYDEPTCPGGSFKNIDACLAFCATRNCRDLDPATAGPQCGDGANCPANTTCRSIPGVDSGSCGCWPDSISSSSSSSTTVYDCGWVGDPRNPSCPSNGTCPEDSTCGLSGTQKAQTCGCIFYSSSSSAEEEE